MYMTAEPTNGPLFTTADPVADEDVPGSDLLPALGCTATFGIFLIVVLVRWDSIALSSDSFAGGRTASMRKLLGRIDQVPVAVILGLLTLVSIYALISAFKEKRHTPNQLTPTK
jgi:hypothetical protein